MLADIDYGHLISHALPAVAAAANIQLAHRAAGLNFQHKSDNSPVTDADIESEAVITAALTAAMPHLAVVGEEAVSEGHVPELTNAFFLVDPLDGTREYISGNDDFTINIALISDGIPIFGIVAAPAHGEIFLTTGPTTAIAGQLTPTITANPNSVDLSRLAPHIITTRLPRIDALTVIASQSHRTQRLEQALAKLPSRENLRVGSSLKFCRIAQGRADVYPRYDNISEWDTAAGHAVLCAAGGAVTTFDGQMVRYGKAAEQFRQPMFVAWGRLELSATLSFS